MDYKFIIPEKDYQIQREDIKKILNPPKVLLDQRISSRTFQQICQLVQSPLVKKINDLPKDLRPLARRLIFSGDLTMGDVLRLGLDIGTKNIVLSYRKEDNIKFRREINGFFNIENNDKFAKTMLQSQRVPFIEDENRLVALGMKAEEIAYTFGHHLSRPMERGVLSVTEKKAMNIMAIIIRSIIGKLENDALLYYCVPANAVNEETNVAYHQKVIQHIIDGYSNEGRKIESFPINEARALVFASFEDKTGVAISCGAGMLNISYCLYGLPVYEFSIVGSGDWIDYESARVTGNLESCDDGIKRPKALVTKAKESINLGGKMPSDPLDRAIFINYEIMLDNVAKNIARGFKENESKARSPKPMPIVCAGGTSKPDGFIEAFKRVIEKQEMPFEIGEISRHDKPLYAVSEGCLLAAEMHEG